MRHHFVSLMSESGVGRVGESGVECVQGHVAVRRHGQCSLGLSAKQTPGSPSSAEGRGTGFFVQVTETELPKGVKSTAVVLDKTIFHSQVPAETSVASHSTKQTYG